MRRALISLLLASLPLASSCSRTVASADGGEASAVCAECGGPSGLHCLYAPSCGAVVRVCAVNTCGDGGSIPHCGCDGRTFFSGCITPDRPFLHTGYCVAEAGVPTDAPTDAGSQPELPYCPREVDHNAPQLPDLRYRRAAFALPPDADADATPDAGASIEATGTWAGTRQLATRILLGCDPADTREECLADTVIRVRRDDGATLELVVGFAPGQLRGLTVGEPVTVSATATRWDGATPVWTSAELFVRSATDGHVLLALSTTGDPPTGFPAPIVVGEPVCRSRPESFCNRTLVAYTVSFQNSGALAPGTGAEVTVGERRYAFTNRVAYGRVLSGAPECNDPTTPVYSYDLVVLPSE